MAESGETTGGMERGEHRILAQDTVHISRAMITHINQGITEETITKTYTSFVFRGRVRVAVRFAT